MPVLLATNVAARGLDVLSIEQVINYELPESAELFTHRIGRTGRMDREGEAITLITPEDLLAWKKIQRELGGRQRPQPWPHHEMPLPIGRSKEGTAPSRSSKRRLRASTVLCVPIPAFVFVPTMLGAYCDNQPPE